MFRRSFLYPWRSLVKLVLSLKTGVLLIFLLLLLIASSIVFAQDSGMDPGEDYSTNPKNRSRQITVNIVDETPPNIPILIAPDNNSSITDPTPAFIWQESTDNKNMGHYDMFLNGSLYLGNIPLQQIDNSQYTLTKTGNQYTLIPKVAFADGDYTWKIRAVDAAGNYRDSATWSFHLDSTAPTFVITTIGEKSVSISAQDLSTLPNPYLEIISNEPSIAGTSEANSDIALLVEVPDQDDENYTIEVDGSGIWSIELPIYPRNIIITLNFTITDPAGNVTILNDVFIMIRQQYLFATPTITPPQGQPSPLASGVEPTPTEVPVLPLPLPEMPLPAIPIAPPREIITNVIERIMPEVVREAVPEVVKEAAQSIAPVGSALISSALPAAATVFFAWQFGWGLSLQILLRILQALGILPAPKPQGIVFNSQTKEPVSFAILNVHRLGDTPTTETLVTSVDGVYGGLTLTTGTYTMDVSHQDFTFPTIQSTPPYLSMFEFYRGELFEISGSQNEQLFMIPVDPIKSMVVNKGFSLSLFRYRLIRIWHYSLIPLFILSIFIYIFYPTLINLSVLGIYVLVIALRLIKGFRKPRIIGTVIDDTGKPLSNVFVRLIVQETNQLAALLLTNSAGKFEGFVLPQRYQLAFTKPDYIWMEGDKPMTIFDVDAREKTQVVVATMKPAAQLLSTLFPELVPKEKN